jgi:outer membrane receptor protein involved in Fe transport
VQPIENFIVGLIVMVAASPALAAPRVAVDLPASTLGDSAIRLARAANVTIGMTDPVLARLRTAPLKGTMTVDRALGKLLAGLPAQAERIDATSWRIVAARIVTPGLFAPTPPPRIKRAPPPVPEADIIVTGSKTGTGFDRYAGTATVLSGADLTLGEQGQGSDALVQRIPTFASTHLGSGRNKLFIRGVADSSFNGPSQAVVGEYLGDVRLNYNAPDPDISLYDVRSVEVIEGPQGTLYGIGALGGIVRIVPEPVHMTEGEVQVAMDGETTAHGGPGYDAVGLINLPVVTGTLGLRALAFKSVEGGYIDDVGRGLSHVNRTRKSGGRATLSARPGDWKVDLGLVLQNIDSDDGQYAEKGYPSLARSNQVAQPFDNDYLLTQATVSRDWGQTRFLSANAFVRQRANSRYDFTPDGAAKPRIFDQQNHIYLFSNETRLSHLDSSGQGWVIGASLLHDEERLTRALGVPTAPIEILGISNKVTEAAVFGEAGHRIVPGLIATAGVRFEYAHLLGEPLNHVASVDKPSRNETAFLPSLSLAWQIDPQWMLFTRYQEGLRPGGLSVTPNQGSAPSAQRFKGDSLSSVEGGIKMLPGAGNRVRATITLFSAHWENIQADLIDMRGLPYTANIGSGRIWGLEAAMEWRPLSAFSLSGALFMNDSRLTYAEPGVTSNEGQEIPNVPHVGLSGRAHYRHALRGAWQIDLEASGHYTGHSRLGTKPNLYIQQGDYVQSSASARIGTERWGFTLQMDNLLDQRGNTFALGNPFDVAQGQQEVPQRPRTLRIGVDARF